MTEAEAMEQQDGQQTTAAATAASSSDDDTPMPQPAKVPRLVAKYKKLHRIRTKSGDNDSSRVQVRKYLEHVDSLLEPSQSALEFWMVHRDRYPSLSRLALQTLAVPATSAPVERVFSRGGIIMRPHRARTSSKLLEMLMFLKCNEGTSCLKDL